LSAKSAYVKSGGGAGQTGTAGRAQISTTARQNFSPLFSARAFKNLIISAKGTMAGALLGPDVELLSVQLSAAWMAA